METSVKCAARNFKALFAFAIALFLLPVAAYAAGATTQRPLDDFLSAQGSFCIDNGVGGCLLFVPPDPNFVGWSTMIVPPKLPIVPSRPEIPLFAGVDYAGLADAYALGDEPQMSGMVTERILNDGRAEVTVMLHTKNANAWVIDLDLSGDVLDQIANKPTLFGHRPIDVVNGAPQALGDSLLHVRFINPAPGAPLPDLVQLVNFGVPGIELTFLAFNMSATGPLTEEYGVAEDTPGRCTIVQKGLVQKAGQSRALTDGFPVETINLSVIGK